MKHPEEKHPLPARIAAISGMSVLAITWLYFDFAVIGARSSLAMIFVFALYYLRQDLVAFAFRMAAPLLFWLNEAEISVWKISVFVPILLYFLLAITGLTNALPSFGKKKPVRRRRAA